MAPKSIKSPQPMFKLRKNISMSESQTTSFLNSKDNKIRKPKNILQNESFVNVSVLFLV